MKTGRSLQELAVELDRQAKTKEDFLAPTDKLSLVVSKQPVDAKDAKPLPAEITMMLGNEGVIDGYVIQDHAHGQIAEHTGIPKPYYDRMRREAPELLTSNIHTWFARFPTRRMLRMLDGGHRAFLSDSYRPLDNLDFGKVILQACNKRKLNVMSCEVTADRLYIKAVDEQLYRDVPVGYKMGDGSHRIFDTCAPVIIASNSEVGKGRLVLETGVYTSACTNLALFTRGGMKRTHLGSRHKVVEATGVEDIDRLLTDQTRMKSDEALWLQLRDVITASFRPEILGERVEALTAATTNAIAPKLVDKVVKVAAVRFGLSEDEQGDILGHLIAGGQLSQYGLHAAVTRAAQDRSSYDRATELEYLGGDIVTLPKTDWDALLRDAEKVAA